MKQTKVHFITIINMKIIFNIRIANKYRINKLKNERIVNKVRILAGVQLKTMLILLAK